MIKSYKNNFCFFVTLHYVALGLDLFEFLFSLFLELMATVFIHQIDLISFLFLGWGIMTRSHFLVYNFDELLFKIFELQLQF
jgi:hypothetical protein